jgi:hypothetical protein
MNKLTPQDKGFNEWLEQFLEEQKHCQKQADRNEELLDELVDEWKKYPDGKPVIKFIGYGR